MLGSTPIPPELGQTVTAAITNLNGQGLGTWIKLGEGIDTFTVPYGDYSEYLFVGGYVNIDNIKSSSMVLPRSIAEITGMEILVVQGNDDSKYGRVQCSPSTQMFTKNRSQDTGLLVSIWAR